MSCLFCSELPTRMFGGKILICDEHYNDFIEEQQLWYKGLLIDEDREMMIKARANGYKWKWEENGDTGERITPEELQELFDEGNNDNFCMAYFSIRPREYKAFCNKHNLVNPNEEEENYNGLTVSAIKEFIDSDLSNMEIAVNENLNYQGLRSFMKKHSIENPNKGKPGKKW